MPHLIPPSAARVLGAVDWFPSVPAGTSTPTADSAIGRRDSICCGNWVSWTVETAGEPRRRFRV